MTSSLEAWLKGLEEVESKATEGPWKINGSGTIICDLTEECTHTIIAPHGGCRNEIEEIDDDAEFIIQSRNALPKLIEIIRIQQGAIKCIAAEHRHRQETEEYWLDLDQVFCATVLATDIKIARNALAAVEKVVES